MNGTRRTVGRRILARRFAAAFALLFVLPVSASWAFADDAAGSSREDVLSLQRRLTDAGCYNGAIDGEANAALDQAIKACPDQSPFLRIETGMHTAIIRKIGVDAACRLIATAADDKTVRLWSIPAGRLERTIRLPIGPGNEGRVLAALSPDGRRLAAGGRDASYAKLGYHSLSFVDLEFGLDPSRRNLYRPDCQRFLLSRRRARSARPARQKRHTRLRLVIEQGIARRSRL